MKKRLIALASVVLALVICIASFAGCNLVTTDSERDMEQIVATVKISDDVEKDEVKKSDMIMAYLNYGYMYVQYYGYTQEKTFNLILDSLVNSRILVQNAILATEKVSAKGADGKDLEDYSRYTAAAYLDADRILDAKYNALKSMNDLLDSYTDDGTTDKKGDSVIGEARTAPTDAKAAEKEVTKEDKEAYIAADNKKTNLLLTSMEQDYRRKAFNDVVKLFRNNGLLGDYDAKDLKTTDYYKQTLESQYENELLDAYNDNLIETARKKYTFDDISDKYAEILEKQQNWSKEEFIAALSATTATEPVLYCGYDGYGYVYNLLLGVNDGQTTKIENIKKDNVNISDDEYAEKRKEILSNTVINDLRSSWIQSGYDFDGTKFTGDYTFAKDAANSLAFQGEIVHLNPDQAEEDDYTAEYGVKSVKSFGLDGFLEFMNGYLGGTLDDSTSYTDLPHSVYNDKIYKLSGVNEYDAKIQELLFAFSTDSGSLNNSKGYVIKPPVDGSTSEEYVETFAKAGRKLLEVGEDSYVVVASDFGYHIMFYSEVLSVHPEYATLSGYLDTLGIDMAGAADWAAYYNAMLEDYDDFEDKDNYLYLLTDSVISTSVTAEQTKKQNEVINKYRYESGEFVKIFKDAYADLLG